MTFWILRIFVHFCLTLFPYRPKYLPRLLGLVLTDVPVSLTRFTLPLNSILPLVPVRLPLLLIPFLKEV